MKCVLIFLCPFTTNVKERFIPKTNLTKAVVKFLSVRNLYLDSSVL